MSQQQRSEAVSRLEALASDLEAVYPQAGELLSSRITPVDEAIRKIGVRMTPLHYIQHPPDGIALDDIEASPKCHPFCLGWDITPGCNIEYGLCAARGADNRCGLYVSRATWTEPTVHLEDSERAERNRQEGVAPGVTRFDAKELDHVLLEIVRPEEVPLPVRMKILDVLDEFVEAYEKHVRDTRANLLNGSVVPQASAEAKAAELTERSGD